MLITYQILKKDDWHIARLQVMSPNQAIPIEGVEGVTFNVPDFPFHKHKEVKSSVKTSSRIYRELRGPECVTYNR